MLAYKKVVQFRFRKGLLWMALKCLGHGGEILVEMSQLQGEGFDFNRTFNILLNGCGSFLFKTTKFSKKYLL